MSKVVDSITGGSQARKAANQAADAQIQSADRAIAFQKESRDIARNDLMPYADLGKRNVSGLESLINDPNAQLKYVQENPFFKALTDQATQALKNNASANFKLNSGGTAEALQNSLMLLGNNLVQQQISNKQNLVSMGQNAAVGQGNITMNSGNSVADLYTQQGNARAAGIVGGSNAVMQGRQSLLNLAGGFIGAGAGAAGAAAGAGAGAGTGSAAIMACDMRFKTDINQVGLLDNGLPIYTFRYKSDPEKLHLNVMAQDVEKVKPEAVIEIDGFKYVDMEKLWH